MSTNGDDLVDIDVVAYINHHYTWGQPGWTLGVDDVHGPGFAAGTLWLEAMVRNTYDPTNPTLNRVRHSFPIPPYLHRAREVDHFVRECIHRAVIHEADEWFRKDGVMIFDPHANDVRVGR